MTSSNSTADARAILKSLKDDLQDPQLGSKGRETTLGNLKVLCRDRNTAASVYNKEGYKIVVSHAFDANDDNISASREALRCVANGLLLVEPTRDFLLEFDVLDKVVERLESDSTDDEFLLSRIIFMVTYAKGSKPALEKIIESEKLQKNLQAALERHAARIEKGKDSSPMHGMALVETVKLVFNLTYHVPEKANLLSGTVPATSKILTLIPLEPFPLVSPVTFINNALINFTLTAEQLQPNPVAVTARAIEILDKATSKPEYLELNSQHEFDEAGSPLLTLIKRLIETNSEDVRRFLDEKLLPRPEDREKAIGKGNSLRDRLLRFTTSGNSANTKDLILSVFFDISNRDAATLVDNIGYGYASGFLFSNNIPVPENAQGGAGPGKNEGVNPITGQTWEAEERENPGNPFEGMTDEEKEREAERLFVLFERLKKTGIIDVVNPVQQAVQEGRFQELPDDE